MKIGIDFTSAARERAGIGRYARELVRALARLDHDNHYTLFMPQDAHPELVAFDWPANFRLCRAPIPERALVALWHRARVSLPVEVFTGGVDIFYSPDFLLPPARVHKTVVTVHDLSYVRLPECYPEVLKAFLNRSVPRSVRRADLVLADASSTRDDLQDLYGVPPAKVQVLYSGVDARFCPEVPAADLERVRTKYDLSQPYLLSVGTIQPRKNYARVIQAFSRLQMTNSGLPVADYQLLISGGKGWMYEDVYDTIQRLGVEDRVRMLGYTPDEDLPALYALATLFVYPSLYEGFGLPVAEAMACGVPVITSNASSLPEVAGDAALYFDPLDVEGMAVAIGRALASEALRNELRTKGFHQVRQFTWDRSARQLLDCFTQL